jgi:hypothetical protein
MLFLIAYSHCDSFSIEEALEIGKHRLVPALALEFQPIVQNKKSDAVLVS